MTNSSVAYVDHMGSDLSVVNAARVSFDKQSEFLPDGSGVDEADQKLIKYLAEHNHWSPFAHAFLSVRIKAPIFVARQLVKHQIGLSWNEVSRRYVDSEPEFFDMTKWRKRPDASIKQGSSDETLNEMEYLYGDGTVGTVDISSHYYHHVSVAIGLYEHMISAGVAPEQARMVLPQSMMTEWIWSGSLYAFARVCNLRLDPHAQAETRDVAQGINDIAKEHFPVSWEVLVE